MAHPKKLKHNHAARPSERKRGVVKKVSSLPPKAMVKLAFSEVQKAEAAFDRLRENFEADQRQVKNEREYHDLTARYWPLLDQAWSRRNQTWMAFNELANPWRDYHQGQIERCLDQVADRHNAQNRQMK